MEGSHGGVLWRGSMEGSHGGGPMEGSDGGVPSTVPMEGSHAGVPWPAVTALAQRAAGGAHAQRHERLALEDPAAHLWADEFELPAGCMWEERRERLDEKAVPCELTLDLLPRTDNPNAPRIT